MDVHRGSLPAMSDNMTKGQAQTMRARETRTRKKLERWAMELVRHGWTVTAPRRSEGGQ